MNTWARYLTLLFITSASFADERLDQIKLQLEAVLSKQINQGQVSIQVQKEVTEAPAQLQVDPTEKRNDDGLITEKAGFKIRYSVYKDGHSGQLEDRSDLSCLRFASDHVGTLLSLDPRNQPADQKQTRIKNSLGYDKIYIQSSSDGVEPEYLEKDGAKYLLIKFRNVPKCDFKTALQLDMWVIQQMLKKAVGNINGITIKRSSEPAGNVKAQ
jgi:hypothetical protein